MLMQDTVENVLVDEEQMRMGVQKVSELLGEFVAAPIIQGDQHHAGVEIAILPRIAQA
jgi:hypothetical protein